MIHYLGAYRELKVVSEDGIVVQFGHQGVGFFGAEPIKRPKVHITKNDTQSLAALMVALEQLGLIEIVAPE